MPPIKFQLNQTYGLGGDVVWRISGHLGYRNGTILAILNLCVTVMPPISSIGLRVWEEMSFEDFQDGRRSGHLGYQNRMILTILNFHVATMPPTKFQLNPTNGSGGDVENVKSLRRTDGRTRDDGWTDRRTKDNRPLHKLALSKAQGELIMLSNIQFLSIFISVINYK